jgi:hypothetical protein
MDGARLAPEGYVRAGDGGVRGAAVVSRLGAGLVLVLATALPRAAVAGEAAEQDDGAVAAVMARAGAALPGRGPSLFVRAFRPQVPAAVALGGLPPLRVSWLVLQPILPVAPSFVPTASPWSLEAPAEDGPHLGVGARGVLEGVLGRVGLASWDGMSLFYQGPFGARMERSLTLGRVPTRFCLTGSYELGDPLRGPGWGFRFMVEPTF